jgi:hypothetical protein
MKGGLKMKKVIGLMLALLLICTVALAAPRLQYLYVTRTVSGNSSWTSSWIEYSMGGVPELSISSQVTSGGPVTIQLLASNEGGSDDGTVVMEYDTSETDWSHTDIVAHNYFAVKIINNTSSSCTVTVNLYE